MSNIDKKLKGMIQHLDDTRVSYLNLINEMVNSVVEQYLEERPEVVYDFIHKKEFSKHVRGSRGIWNLAYKYGIHNMYTWKNNQWVLDLKEFKDKHKFDQKQMKWMSKDV